jgi:hypothetical protein
MIVSHTFIVGLLQTLNNVNISMSSQSFNTIRAFIREMLVLELEESKFAFFQCCQINFHV